jgi:hypothetical protein
MLDLIDLIQLPADPRITGTPTAQALRSIKQSLAPEPSRVNVKALPKLPEPKVKPDRSPPASQAQLQHAVTQLQAQLQTQFTQLRKALAQQDHDNRVAVKSLTHEAPWQEDVVDAGEALYARTRRMLDTEAANLREQNANLRRQVKHLERSALQTTDAHQELLTRLAAAEAAALERDRQRGEEIRLAREEARRDLTAALLQMQGLAQHLAGLIPTQLTVAESAINLRVVQEGEPVQVLVPPEAVRVTVDQKPRKVTKSIRYDEYSRPTSIVETEEGP